MRFLLDESVDARLALYRRQQGHNVTIIAVDYPASLADHHILRLARSEQRILITNDRDFGELVVAHHHAHTGVILLRLDPFVKLATKLDRLEHVLTHHASQLDQFLVVTRDRVRVRRIA